MVSDAGLIVVSIISLAGMVLLFALNNSTWFKKENFKIQKKAVMDENRIKLKKMEKELGLTSTTRPYREPQTTLETGGNVLNLLKNLNGEQLQTLADKFLGNEETDYEEQPKGTIDSLLEFANNNPELAAEFLEKFSGKKDSDTENIFNK